MDEASHRSVLVVQGPAGLGVAIGVRGVCSRGEAEPLSCWRRSYCLVAGPFSLDTGPVDVLMLAEGGVLHRLDVVTSSAAEDLFGGQVRVSRSAFMPKLPKISRCLYTPPRERGGR